MRQKDPPTSRSPLQPLRELTPIVLLLLLIGWVALGANPFQGQIVAPMDLMLSAQAWPEVQRTTDFVDPDKSDILDAWLPRWIYVKERILNFELPLWNPLIAGGQPALPLLADSYISPSFLLFLMFPDGLGYTLGLLVRLLIAGLGTYLLCRTNFHPLPSLLGSVTFMLCGFNLSWLMWPQVATSCWVPWVLWATIRLLDRPSPKKIAALALTVALMIFGGFPAVAGYALYLVALVTAWIFVSRRVSSNGRTVAALGAGITLGFLLTSAQLVPFVEYLRHVDLSWRQAWSLPLDGLVFLLSPFYEGADPHPELTGYVGWTAMLIAPFALVSGHWKGPFSSLFWTLVAVLSLALAYGQPSWLTQAFYQLPVFDSNPNGRLLSLFGMSMAILVAAGSNAIQLRLNRTTARLLLLLLITGQTADLIRVGWAQNAVVADEDFFPKSDLLSELEQQIIPGQSVLDTSDAFGFPGLLAAYGLKDWYAHTHRLPGERAFLNCLVENPWVTYTAAQVHFEDIGFGYPCTDLLSVRFVLADRPVLTAQRKSEEPQNIQPGQNFLQSFVLEHPSRITGFEVLTATGGGSVLPKSVRASLLNEARNTLISAFSNQIEDNDWTEFWLEIPLELEPGQYYLRFEVNEAAPGQGLYVWTAGQSSAFRILGNRTDLRQDWQLQTRPSLTVLENQKVPGGAFLSEDLNPSTFSGISWDGVEFLEGTAESWSYRVETNGPTWLVRSARVWPGWQASVNGKPAKIEAFRNYLPAVRVGVGTHLVDWRYRPTSLTLGVLLSLLSVLLVIVLSFKKP